MALMNALPLSSGAARVWGTFALRLRNSPFGELRDGHERNKRSKCIPETSSWPPSRPRLGKEVTRKVRMLGRGLLVSDRLPGPNRHAGAR